MIALIALRWSPRGRYMSAGRVTHTRVIALRREIGAIISGVGDGGIRIEDGGDTTARRRADASCAGRPGRRGARGRASPLRGCSPAPSRRATMPRFAPLARHFYCISFSTQRSMIRLSKAAHYLRAQTSRKKLLLTLAMRH